MAVTREGVPVRVWSFPGTSSDQVIIRKVKDDLGAWGLHRVIWCLDRGFNSAENRRYLQRAGGHIIVGERLRSDSTDAKAALARPGRYREVAGNLRVTEVRVGTERFVICHNPERARRDEVVRSRIVAHLEARIEGSDCLSRDKRLELYGALSTKSGLKRFLRLTKDAKLRVDKTVRAWGAEILSFHVTGISTGPVEAQNLVTEKLRRIGHGMGMGVSTTPEN